MSAVVAYRWGQDRNEPDRARQHLYAETKAGNLWPMCEYGWNRSGGHRFSILRGPYETPGMLWPPAHHCRLCMKAYRADARPVHRPKGHKTKWL